MSQTRQIDTQNWSEFLVSFSDGNRGRAMGVEIFSMDVGDQSVFESAPLLDITFGPGDQKDGIVISAGETAGDYEYVVEGPTELWEATKDNGVSNALEIIARGGIKTVLLFKS